MIADNGMTRLHSSLGRLNEQINAWIRGRLWLQVIIGLILGIIVGTLLGPDLKLVSRYAATQIGAWLALPGKLFLGLIAMVLVPLVMASIVQGLTGAQSGAELKSVGGKFLIYVIFTTTLAATLGVAITLYFKPGSYIELPESIHTVPVESAEQREEKIERLVPDLIADLIPTNPSIAIKKRDMLAIVILAIFLGLAARSAKPSKIKHFLSWLDGFLEISMIIIKWAMFLAPWAVFGLMADLVAKVGTGTILGMTAYVLTVIGGLVLLLFLYLLLVFFLAKWNPIKFLASVGGAMLLGFSTSSSAAVMPVSIKTATEKLNVPENIASLVVPLGATINMAGTALYQSAAVIFLAQMSGISLSNTEMIMIIGTLVASSIGAPGTPGVSIVILENVINGFGIPTVGLVLILGVDRILDMCRTAVNLTGDLAAALIINKK